MVISLEYFGASADYQRLYTEFGITADAVAQAARDSLTQAGAGLDAIRPGGVQDTSAPDTGWHRRPARLTLVQTPHPAPRQAPRRTRDLPGKDPPWPSPNSWLN